MSRFSDALLFAINQKKSVRKVKCFIDLHGHYYQLKQTLCQVNNTRHALAHLIGWVCSSSMLIYVFGGLRFLYRMTRLRINGLSD